MYVGMLNSYGHFKLSAYCVRVRICLLRLVTMALGACGGHFMLVTVCSDTCCSCWMSRVDLLV